MRPPIEDSVEKDIRRHAPPRKAMPEVTSRQVRGKRVTSITCTEMFSAAAFRGPLSRHESRDLRSTPYITVLVKTPHARYKSSRVSSNVFDVERDEDERKTNGVRESAYAVKWGQAITLGMVTREAEQHVFGNAT